MVPILTDLTTPALVRAVKSNFNALFLSLKASGAAQFHTEPGLSRWHIDIPHPWFNGVLASRPPAGNEAAAIQGALDYFQSQGVQVFTWWVEPGVSLDAWGSCLEPFGFQLDHSTPGMAIDLKGLPQDISVPPGLRIVPVADLDTLKDWARALVLGFEMPDAWEPVFYNMFADLGFTHPFHHYLGYLGDMPAVASTMFLSAGVAGIYNVATLPEARSRGLGTALTAVPLKEALDKGYLVGILQSSAMGYPVYERLGFKKVCEMENYYWSAKGKN